MTSPYFSLKVLNDPSVSGLKLNPLPPPPWAVISMVVGAMVDKPELSPSPAPPAAAAAAAVLPQDVLSVFQFHSYVVQHDVQDMGAHLLGLAREGEGLQCWEGDTGLTFIVVTPDTLFFCCGSLMGRLGFMKYILPCLVMMCFQQSLFWTALFTKEL